MCLSLITGDIEKYTAYLGQRVHVEMDRPKGSKHPSFDFIYETNYGFVPGTTAGDGHEIDAYVIGQDSPLKSFDGECIAVVVRKDDAEHKLIVADHLCSKSEIYDEVRFVEDYYDTEIILAGGA